MPRPPSLLSDDLLRQLIAVGQVDVVVGIPTLDNAATVGAVAAAAHLAAAATAHQQRVLLLNSDGGSTDGTQEAVARATHGDSATVLASHSLRTLHRVIAPFHGLPGKQAAVRRIFTVAELVQARGVLIADPANAAPAPDFYRALIRPVVDDGIDAVGTAPDRDPREGPLVTQVIRPLLVAGLGATFEDPVGDDLAVSAAFVRSALAEQVAWEDGPLRPGVDLWLRVHALASGMRTRQVRTAPRVRAATPRPPLREVVQQILLAVWTCLAHYDRAGLVTGEPETVVLSSGVVREPEWDVAGFDRQLRDAWRDLGPLWRTLVTPATCEGLAGAIGAPGARIGDELWADVLIDVSHACLAGRIRPEDAASAFVPIYLGRVGGFLTDVRGLPADDVRRRLDDLVARVAAARARLHDRAVTSPLGGS